MVYALGYDIRIAALIGSILTVTGPTVIAPLLRHVNPGGSPLRNSAGSWLKDCFYSDSSFSSAGRFPFT